MSKPKSGGKRANAGREKLPEGEKKVTVNLYLQVKEIENIASVPEPELLRKVHTAVSKKRNKLVQSGVIKS